MGYKTEKKTPGVSIDRMESSVFTVRYLIIIGFSSLFSYSTHVFNTFYVCFLFCIFVLCVVYCFVYCFSFVLSLSYFCTVYRPLPQGGNPTAVNKYSYRHCRSR
jgi:hypothetical protein